MQTALTRSIKKAKQKMEPPWTGPCGDGPNGGVTQGLIRRFLRCREHFRLFAVEGWAALEGFNHRTAYGDMWHLCEAAHADGQEWRGLLLKFCQGLAQRFPLQQEEIDKWHRVCRLQFPLYVKYWERHPDVLARTPLLAEQPFDVPYQLPSGRTIRLRGKWDSVDLVGKGKEAKVWLMENKTKGDLDEAVTRRRLASGVELQTMLYLVAMKPDEYDLKIQGALAEAGARSACLTGVRYNCILRPLSGGKGTITRHKEKRLKSGKIKPAETKDHFYGRVAKYIEDEPERYFMRWNVDIEPAAIARFRHECLDPVLEQMCDWWDFIQHCPDLFRGPNGSQSIHWRTPAGCFDQSSQEMEYDEYLVSGSTAGLRKVTTVFPELIP